MKDRHDMTVLLLEDQPLIAIDTDAMLRHSGFVHIVHITSVEQASAWLSNARPDLAITEITLRSEPSTVLAEHLARQNVPFLIYSGANRSLVDDRVLRSAPWLSKPSDTGVLERAIAGILQTQRL